MDSSKDFLFLKKTLDDDIRNDEENALLLGASNADECSYDKGYVKRQMVYVCRTCQHRNPGSLPGGFCYACMLNCHPEHDIIELQTRRYFKCDCGNSKFIGNPCNLEPEKDVVNAYNRYDANFLGMPNGPSIQCIVCEEWIPKPEEFPTMEEIEYDPICAPCTSRLSFLGFYRQHLICMLSTTNDQSLTQSLELPSNGRNDKCEILRLFVPDMVQLQGISAWEMDLRKSLCTCLSCKKMYADANVSFIVDVEDTFEEYCNIGVAKHEETKEAFEQRMESLDRFQKGELAAGIAKFTTAFTEMLKKSTKKGYHVTLDDVQAFKDKLNRKQ